MRDKITETLESMLDGANKGYFWIGSTSTGRHMIDRAVTLPELITLALEAEKARPIGAKR